MKYISVDNLAKLLEKLKKDYHVFVPVKNKEQRFYKRYSGVINEVVIGEVRAFEPLKSSEDDSKVRTGLHGLAVCAAHHSIGGFNGAFLGCPDSIL